MVLPQTAQDVQLLEFRLYNQLCLDVNVWQDTMIMEVKNVLVA